MVTVPAHEVLVYPDAGGHEAAYLALKAQRAPGMVPADMNKDEYQILLMQSSSEYTLLRFRQHAKRGTGILNPAGSNFLLYAHGEGAYPAMHNAGDVKTITWTADIETAVGKVS